MIIIIRWILVLIFFLGLLAEKSFSVSNDAYVRTVVIDADKVLGTVNPFVYGSSIMGYDPSTITKGKKKYTGYSNYGGGVWNPVKKESVHESTGLIKRAGIKSLRFPGGKGSTFYNWKKTIGSTEKRPDFLYGLNEFLITCKQVSAEAVLVLPYFSGNSQDAADLVEYLNSPYDGSNPGGGKDWAEERAKHGYSEPYGVSFFELGNEVNYGRKEMNIPPVKPEKYAADYLAYRNMMKSVDSSVQLGAVTVNSHSVKGISPWNNTVFQIAGHKIDFLIEHTYRPNYSVDDEKVDANKIFESTLNSLDHVDTYYKMLARHFEKVTGRKDIPLAITEYNARFIQEKPVPFRHTLGTALFNAGLLQLFLKPENSIMMANYHQFINSYWGMIRNDQFIALKGHYIKRPNYYVFEMFSKHFGSDLLSVKNTDLENLIIENMEINLLAGVKWDTKLFSKANIKIASDDVAIYFNQNADLNFTHVRKKVPVKPNTTYRLSGYLKADNLIDSEGVGLEIQDARGWKKTRSAMTTGRVWGTTDWTYVEAEYTTLSDASHVLVMIRRKKGQGPVKGKVFIKDVELTEITKERREGSLSFSASSSPDNQNIYIMALNKNIYQDIYVVIHLESKRELSKQVTVWTLNAPSVWAHNENDPNTVIIKNKSLELSDTKQIHYTFPAHSLTALELRVP